MTGGFFQGENGELFTSAAHELKSPLALIRQLSLYIESGEFDPDEVVEMARKITLTSEKTLRLTSDLTRSVQAGQMNFQLEPINVKPLIDDVAQQILPLYLAKNRKLELRIGNPGLVLANRDLLERILVNFLDNALHYSFNGENVILEARTRGDNVRCAVRDFGPAVPMATWQKLQKSLGRPVAFQSRPQSSGLGLYIAEQFAQAMRAQVGATRHQDGASFFVDLKTSRQLSLI